MMLPDHARTIQRRLRSLGAAEAYAGFSPTVYAVQLAINDPNRLRLITKLIYMDAAGRYDTTWTAVERNIRTIVSAAWRNDPLLLSELAGSHLSHRPNNTRFLAILAASCSRGAI